MPVSTFDTVSREAAAINPALPNAEYPKLAALSAPHIESFNSIFQPLGGTVLSGGGLLDKAIEDIPKKIIFDKRGASGTLGNKIECKKKLRIFLFLCLYLFYFF